MNSKKNIFLFPLAAAFFFLSSCFNLTEVYDLKEDGSGKFTINLDMSRMLEMMNSFSKYDTSSDKEKKKKDEDKDTTIYFAKNIDEAENLTAEEKKLYRDGSMHIVMKEAEKKFFFDITFPFKNQEDLMKVYTSYPTALKNIDFKKAMGNDSSENKMVGRADEMSLTSQYLDLNVGKGFIERRVNKDKMKETMEKDSSLKMMLPMLSGMYVSSVFHLPHPVKKVDNPYATLSEDKKTITFKFPVSDYVERPEVMNFRLEY